MIKPSTPWIRPLNRVTQPRLILFAFPHAGGGASSFHAWTRFVPADVALYAIQYPGRETRIAEVPVGSMQEMIPVLAQAITPFLQRPSIFFGHSLGAMVAFETVQFLAKQKAPLPQHLFVSAARAPHVPVWHEPYHKLPGEQFWQKLKELNGTPTAVFQHPEFKALFEPMLRADFALAETYFKPEPDPIHIPLTALAGMQDTHVALDDVLAWASHTTALFRHHHIQGDHFFIQAQAATVTSILLNYTYSVIGFKSRDQGGSANGLAKNL
ncbi:MAG: thioesterase [Anaerolineales bacterium]|nr:thioesterase [Anaerolineales bacterium]